MLSVSEENTPELPNRRRRFEEIDQEALLKGFFGIMDLWQVSSKQARAILGQPSASTFFEWRRGDNTRLPADTICRIGYIAGIVKALQIIYSDPGLAASWIKRPNRQFGGQTPLGRITAGDVTDLSAVLAYVDAAQAPWS